MTQRYFVDSLPGSGGLAQLPTNEAQHAFRVMRLAVGSELVLFDGRGNEAKATVSQINRRECVCEAQPAQKLSKESSVHLHLAIAIPKGDRAKEMIMRLTELGVSEVTPITSARSQRAIGENATEKLSRVVIEASKQCGRNHLLLIHEPKTLKDFVATMNVPAETRWILHTRLDEKHEKVETSSERITALVGPEGGWTEDDLQISFEAGFKGVSLGSRTLRIETAAVAVAAICCCTSTQIFRNGT